MKKINTLLLSAALVSALASCEMKEELIGGKGSSDEMGLLDLTVATSSSSNTVVTKAVTDEVNDFPVYIVAAPGDTTKRFASFAELKEQNPIELPFGTYTVVSNSPVPYERKMQYPYYKGEESVEISEVTGKTTVTCTIQNVKIAFVPSAAFRNTYSDWTITVSDRLETSNNSDALIATFTPANSGTDSEQAYEYWKLGNDVDKIYINGTATLKDGGETVPVYGVAEKKNLEGHEDADGNFFKGGDELVINLNPDKIEGSTAGVEKPGVIITIGGFNSETNETIEIEVTGDGGDVPTPPAPSGEISLQLPEDITYSISEGNAPEKADAIITAPKGLKNVIVKIVPGNDKFEGILGQLKLGEADDPNAPTFLGGVDIIDNKYLEAVFTGVGQSISAPTLGETEPYTFPIGNFFTFLNITGATDSGTPHQFVIEVTDNEGNKANGTLNVTINE